MMAPEVIARPEKFSGQHFKRWQQKMRFWLTSLSLFSVIENGPPSEEENEPARSVDLAQFRNKDYLCIGSILTCLSDSLYDHYCTVNSAQDLWLALDKKYGIEDVGLDKIKVADYLDYKMKDGLSIVDQAHEIQSLVYDILQCGMTIDYKFQVCALISKLPPSWYNFSLSLQHKRENMTVEDLISALQVEEKNRERNKTREPIPESFEFLSKANYVEKSNPAKPTKKFFSKKPKNFKGKKKVNEQKSIAACYVCGRPGHKAYMCKDRKDKKKKNLTNKEHEVNMLTVVEP